MLFRSSGVKPLSWILNCLFPGFRQGVDYNSHDTRAPLLISGFASLRGRAEDDYSTQNALLPRLGVFAPLLALNAVVAIRSARPGVLGVLPRVTDEEAT